MPILVIVCGAIAGLLLMLAIIWSARRAKPSQIGEDQIKLPEPPRPIWSEPKYYRISLDWLSSESRQGWTDLAPELQARLWRSDRLQIRHLAEADQTEPAWSSPEAFDLMRYWLNTATQGWVEIMPGIQVRYWNDTAIQVRTLLV